MSSHFLKQLHLCHTWKPELLHVNRYVYHYYECKFYAVPSIPSYQINKEYLPILRVMVGSLDEVVLDSG